MTPYGTAGYTPFIAIGTDVSPRFDPAELQEMQTPILSHRTVVNQEDRNPFKGIVWGALSCLAGKAALTAATASIGLSALEGIHEKKATIGSHFSLNANAAADLTCRGFSQTDGFFSTLIFGVHGCRQKIDNMDSTSYGTAALASGVTTLVCTAVALNCLRKLIYHIGSARPVEIVQK